MREDLSYSCTHNAVEPQTVNAEPCLKIRYSNAGLFGQFWVGPKGRTIAGPIVLLNVHLPKGSVLKLGTEDGPCDKPVIYEIDIGKAFFIEVTPGGEITDKTIPIDEALETWPVAEIFFVAKEPRFRRATDDPDVYFARRTEEIDIESGRVPFYNYGRR